MMALVVRDSYQLASQRPTDAEILERAEVWARVLWPDVPPAQLQAAHDLAFRTKTGDYSVTARDILNAARELQAEAAKPVERQPVHECPRCHGTDVEMVYSVKGEKLGARPGCDHRPLQPGEWLHQLEMAAKAHADGHPAPWEAAKSPTPFTDAIRAAIGAEPPAERDLSDGRRNFAAGFEMTPVQRANAEIFADLGRDHAGEYPEPPEGEVFGGCDYLGCEVDAARLTDIGSLCDEHADAWEADQEPAPIIGQD